MSKEVVMQHAFICTDNKGAMYLDEVITTSVEDSKETVLGMIEESENTHIQTTTFNGQPVMFVYNEGVAGNGADDHDLYLPSIIIGKRVDACIVVTHNAALNTDVLTSIAVYQKAFLDGDADTGEAEVDKWGIDKKEYICKLMMCILDACNESDKEEK